MWPLAWRLFNDCNDCASFSWGFGIFRLIPGYRVSLEPGYHARLDPGYHVLLGLGYHAMLKPSYREKTGKHPKKY